MQTNTDGRLEQALAALDDLRSLVRERGFSQSELFLDMAKLQLQLDLNGITDHEFNAFCDAVERGGVVPGPADRARPGQARQRRNGELRTMRNTYVHCSATMRRLCSRSS